MALHAWANHPPVASTDGTPEYKDMALRDIFLDVVKRNTPMDREQTAAGNGNLVAFLYSDDAVNSTEEELTR